MVQSAACNSKARERTLAVLVGCPNLGALARLGFDVKLLRLGLFAQKVQISGMATCSCLDIHLFMQTLACFVGHDLKNPSNGARLSMAITRVVRGGFVARCRECEQDTEL